MIGERQKFERLSRDFSRLSEELKRCDEERIQLSGQKGQLEAQLSALEEECESLKADLASGSMSPDEIVKLAWQRRDEAVKRKNACEIALAKSRIENMQLSSQLMEVVQQKSRLAQQVAQFEVSILLLLIVHYTELTFRHFHPGIMSWSKISPEISLSYVELGDRWSEQTAPSVGVAWCSFVGVVWSLCIQPNLDCNHKHKQSDCSNSLTNHTNNQTTLATPWSSEQFCWGCFFLT